MEKNNRIRRTKIVCTLGPATDRDNNLEQIIIAGANVVRLNFSHGTQDEHIQRAQQVRELAKKHNKTVAILGDLQGPKIRISTFENGEVLLENGADFILDAELDKGKGTKTSVGLDYKELAQDLVIGDILLLDDGRIQLQVTKVDATKIFTKVTIGGILYNNKGINKLGGGLSAEALTDKDKSDILVAAKIDVDYLAVSFPRNGEDMKYARKLAMEAGLNAQIVAKVERAEAVASVEAMDDIILASDVVMVARGDLGVEIGDAELVAVQKQLIQRTRDLNRVTITATQMMESMVNNSMPTRAEVMDVANAVLDGTDAVMLSAETAAGKYPVETVISMAKVCLGAEKMAIIKTSQHRMHSKFDIVEETIAMAAMYSANHLHGVKAVVSMTSSGASARYASRISSGLPIYGISRNTKTLNLLALYRGVNPIFWDGGSSTFSAAKAVVSFLKDQGHLTLGDLVIVTHGSGDNSGFNKSNTCRILPVE